VVSVLTVHPPISQTHSLRISRQPFPVPRARLLECGTTRPAHGVAWRRVVSPHCFAGALTTAAASPSIDSVGWGVKPRAAHAPYVPASLLPAAAGCRLDAFVAVVRGGEAPGPGRAPEPEFPKCGAVGIALLGVRGWECRARACVWLEAMGMGQRSTHCSLAQRSSRLAATPLAFSLCCAPVPIYRLPRRHHFMSAVHSVRSSLLLPYWQAVGRPAGCHVSNVIAFRELASQSQVVLLHRTAVRTSDSK
jgi:hypothetical protein